MKNSRSSDMTSLGKFLVTGGISALLTVAIRAAMSLFMNFEYAVALSYIVGMTIAYALSRTFVFIDHDISVQNGYVRFALVNVMSFCIVWSVSVGLEKVLFPMVHLHWHDELIAHCIGVASPALPSYFAHRRFTFPARKT